MADKVEEFLLTASSLSAKNLTNALMKMLQLSITHDQENQLIIRL